MARTRSPRYPNIPLSEAIQRVAEVYAREQTAPTSADVMAEAMGYSGLNGTSLKMLSSLRKYGLIEGRGDTLRVSKDAQALILDPPGSPDYEEALKRCAFEPDLFSALFAQFGQAGSERSIAVYLQKQGFKPNAASLTAKNFRDTIALITDTTEKNTSDEHRIQGEPSRGSPDHDYGELGRSRDEAKPVEAKEGETESEHLGISTATFPLEEGVASLSWPKKLSLESYEDFESWVHLMLRRAKRDVIQPDQESD